MLGQINLDTSKSKTLTIGSVSYENTITLNYVRVYGSDGVVLLNISVGTTNQEHEVDVNNYDEVAIQVSGRNSDNTQWHTIAVNDIYF